MPQEPGPLAGIDVLELGGGVSVASCGRLLRGFGAAGRRLVVGEDTLDLDETAFYTTGAEPVDGVSDDAASTARLATLIAEADVIVDGTPPGWLARRGLGPARLRRTRPDLIVCSVTPFGQDGPHADHVATNAVQFARGGIMSLTGDPHRPPLVTGGNQAQLLGGLHAFAALTCAILGRARSGFGCWIDLSVQECAASMLELYAAQSEYTAVGAVPRSGNSVRATWGV